VSDQSGTLRDDLFALGGDEGRSFALNRKLINVERTELKSADFSEEQLFFYIYGVLHSADYRARFAQNLRRELPRLPIPTEKNKFLAISEAGQRLSELHVNFTNVKKYDVTIEKTSVSVGSVDDKSYYRVQRMRFAGTRGNEDKSTVIYNEHITIKNIPLEAYEYVVNGKPALEWVMERQCVKVDKDSGIVNDANDYANETMNNPAYPLELFQRVITVSLETMKIVKSLPKLDL
jgi:predicted helicase